ncbi:MAG: hypothetical protein JKY42_10780 [Flavobacteriales bacterium]|nr:hypothetical protein [Flavobacteriales bacterium]
MSKSSNKIDVIIDQVISQIECDDYRGYDPYDTLNSPIFKHLGKWGRVLATQIQKRNPVNIRPLIGIKKEINPKGIGLILEAYSKLYRINPSAELRDKCENLFSILKTTQCNTASNVCWGYNFDWTSPKKTMPRNYPNVVVTSFIIQGIQAFADTFNDSSAYTMINGASNYVLNNLYISKTDPGKCISYSGIEPDYCYNASLLAAEILAINYAHNNNADSKEIIISALEFVLSKQKRNGCWYYSYNPTNGSERKQVDFHQGYILNSLKKISELINYTSPQLENSLEQGLNFYKKNQFDKKGKSLWRLPKTWPVDIHNQAQGITTFVLFADFQMAETIVDWTIENMYTGDGSFYYKKYPLYSIKTTFTRWSQAWMLLSCVNYKLSQSA